MLFLLFLSVSRVYGFRSGWDYDHVTDWSHEFAECGLNSQSPIDVTTDGLSDCADTLSLDWESEPTHYVVRNNGHSLQCIPFEIDAGGDLAEIEVLHHTDDINITLTNSFYNTYESNVNKEYCFDSAHFHWGDISTEGSEHTVDGIQYPLEIHLVHYSCDYYELKHAATAYAGDKLSDFDDKNILAVIGVLFEIGEANIVLEKILEDLIIDGIADFDEDITGHLELYYTEFDISGLVPTNREYIGYEGSLTTPPCYETVRWHVMTHQMTVSEDQLFRFRELNSDLNHSIGANYRPVQPLNDRKLYKCDTDISDLFVEKETESKSILMQINKNYYVFLLIFCAVWYN